MRAAFRDNLLKGRHIVITGGGTGLGRVMALTCAELGARVTINGRREEPLSETVEKIREQGGEAEGITCNIREKDAVDACLYEAEERQGDIDGLVNNAAANFLAPSEELSPGGLAAIVETNLYGSFFCTQWCGKRWIERETGGSVVSIVTTYADSGSAFVAPSAMSKSGIAAMTKSLAAEWGYKGIRLNAVAPGPIPTEGAWKRLMPSEKFAERMERRIPLQRFGNPEELADLVTFLLSDVSSYVTGAVIPMDGGERLVAGGQFNEFTRLPRGEVRQWFEKMREMG